MAIGCLLDVVNALACIGTAVAVYPAVRRNNESLALGFVISRTLEAAVIMVGMISLLAIVSLRHDFSGDPRADQATLLTTGQALLAVRNWTFLFGPNLCAALNALLFGTLLFRSRLVPRAIPAMGLIGAPLLLAATVVAAVGAVDQGSAWFIGAMPVAAWELSVGLYLTTRGLRTATDSV